ncbi:MAG: amidase [Rhodospirillales bacterium]|jgi:Asp-tRNA(Asn)/Glu-tRNA(Gln) amidotransferase A subunit family amidase|nr:amidase [Rhodospirillales bacterium]MDB5382423.1 amidase [Rhodospirillales bacterium]
MGYDPRDHKPLAWHDATPRFTGGGDTPRDYLERCLGVIGEREPGVLAWVTLNETGARSAADASTARWRDGSQLSAIDGMPIGIKDLLETLDMPTEQGCVAYRGDFPKRDNAAVAALRDAGAVILGKTVTTELGASEPGPTRNPFDPSRTPGGSSSGSAAAVAARMIPAAIGSQVGGSIIRPSSYCGNVALKPTQGAINRGERQSTSMSTHGVHAGCIEDMWQVAIEIAKRAGGDPGRMSLKGPDTAPPPRRPHTLAVLETEGWTALDARSRGAFESLLEQLAATGIRILRRADHAAIETLEQRLGSASAMANGITGWEGRWSLRALVANHPEGVSDRAKRRLVAAEAMTVADYEARLAERADAQAAHARIASLADAVIMLSSPGPAPVWAGDIPGQPINPRPTGDITFNAPSSALFAPAVTMPLLAVGGMPLGVQLMGQMGQDADITALARWMLAEVAPVVV